MSDDSREQLKRGNRIKILCGTFENFEAVVTSVDEAAGKVSAEIWVFGRATPVELDRAEVVRIPWRKPNDRH